MRILFDRNVPGRYMQAIAAEPWSDTDHCDTHFPPTADDEDITDYAVRNQRVVFTRDDDFFRFAKHRNCGLLYLPQSRSPTPGVVVEAIETIEESYTDHSEIVAGVPGDWV